MIHQDDAERREANILFIEAFELKPTNAIVKSAVALLPRPSPQSSRRSTQSRARGGREAPGEGKGEECHESQTLGAEMTTPARHPKQKLMFGT
jgi:hypothetical protein